MIFILIRETYIELPVLGKRCIDRLPTLAFSELDHLLEHCNEEGFIRISGSGSDSTFTRISDLSITKQNLKTFFQIQSAMKITEQFVIFEQELR